jgi:hypothetical protein
MPKSRLNYNLLFFLSVKLALVKFAPAMKRVLIGFFLSLFIFLSGGYTQVYAHSLRQSIVFSPKQIVRASLPGTDKVHHGIDATAIEEEDDQPTSSKKYIDHSAVTVPIYSSSTTVQCLPISKSSANTLCSRSYILFRVFRI